MLPVAVAVDEVRRGAGVARSRWPSRRRSSSRSVRRHRARRPTTPAPGAAPQCPTSARRHARRRRDRTSHCSNAVDLGTERCDPARTERVHDVRASSTAPTSGGDRRCGSSRRRGAQLVPGSRAIWARTSAMRPTDRASSQLCASRSAGGTGDVGDQRDGTAARRSRRHRTAPRATSRRA